jgi:hypothetical protein
VGLKKVCNGGTGRDREDLCNGCSSQLELFGENGGGCWVLGSFAGTLFTENVKTERGSEVPIKPRLSTGKFNLANKK